MSEQKTIKVLIVDDHAGMRKLVHLALRTPEYEFYEAESAIEALDLLETVHPQVIISDVMMPGMDGFTFCEKVRSKPETANAFICMLTSLGNEEYVERGRDAGADSFLAKPFSIHELMQVVDKGIKSHVVTA